MKTPEIDDFAFENHLRREITNNFIKNSALQFRYRITAVAAYLFAVFAIIVVLKPDLAKELHHFAFGKTNPIEQNTETAYERIPNSIIDPLQLTTLNNPDLQGKINPAEYTEDKTYIIRRYSSQKDGPITIISEFDSEKQKQQLIKYLNQTY